MLAIAAENNFCIALVLTPNHWSMTSQFIVAKNAGIEFAAAFELDRDQITIGVKMRALRAFIDFDPAHHVVTPQSKPRLVSAKL